MQTAESIPSPLRILHLEDDEHDAEIIAHRLTQEEFEVQIVRVQSKSEFLRVLKEQPFDLILADRALRSFDGFHALEIVLKETPDTPFLFVTGTLGEDQAVESVKCGATDYVLKNQLLRLNFSVRRALRETRERQARKLADARLRQSQQELADFFEHAPVGLHWAGPDGRILKANQAELAMFGYSYPEYVGHQVEEFHENPLIIRSILARLAAGETDQNFEARIRCKDGSIKDVLIASNALMEDGRFVHTRNFTRDITARKRAESGIAAVSKLGRLLSSASSPGEAAQIIAEVADELFGWDAFMLDLFSAEQDTLQTILGMDILNGRKCRLPAGAPQKPPPIARRVMAKGAELVLKQQPAAHLSDALPFGDTSRPSASIMLAAIQYRGHVVGIISIHSYTVRAYDREDLGTLRTFADYCGGALERMRAEEKVAVLNTQLLNAARRAGMEEVASSVLHNVGNVLNSVNVSAALITESLSNSQLTGFKRIVELVQANAGQLGRFLAEDPQGRQVPEYLRALARYWEEEQTASLKELERLNKNIQHIKDIIGRQQSLTGMSGFAEQVYISELVEDALTLGAANLERSGITVIREFHMHEPMLIDRMKFMLVFVNLINNARDSLLESTVKDKQLKVRTELRPDRYLRVEVIDNGSGIAPGNMTRIFSHGFTTKKTGHGFGLHSSALAAKEMGGTLNVQSDGPGKGACFIIEMPLQPLPAKGSVS